VLNPLYDRPGRLIRTVCITKPQFDLPVHLKRVAVPHLDKGALVAHVQGRTTQFFARSFIQDNRLQRSLHPPMLPPVSAANLTGGAAGLDCGKFGRRQQLWNQIGLVDERAVWAAPIGIVVATLPGMPLHGLEAPKKYTGSKYTTSLG
jgi:hypothetical protein